MLRQPNDKVQHLRLVSPESSIDIGQLNDSLKQEICNAIANGQATVIEDVVKLFNIPYESAVALFNDQTFLSLIKKSTNAKLQFTFHTNIPKELDNIIRNGEVKEKLQAMKLAAQLTDNLKQTGTDVSVNINLESLVKETEKQVTPQMESMEAEFRKVS